MAKEPNFFKTTPEHHIKRLKAEASELQIAKNSLVFEQVRINVALAKPGSDHNVDALTKRKNEINEQLKQTQYTEQLPKLTKQIGELELKTKGHADTDDSKPQFRRG
jgi:hypothetical protein